MPVLGSGHPQADIMLLKFAPVPSEVEEGVAFYGRAGSALMKSFKRLGIDPLTVYGTVFVKCPVEPPSCSAPECRARVLDELAIVQPRIVVVMGEEALEELNSLGVPLGAELARRRGRRSSASRRPATACTCPTSTRSLDDERVKREFWGAFRSLGAGTRTSRPTSGSRRSDTLALANREGGLGWPRRPGSSSWRTARRSRRSCSRRSGPARCTGRASSRSSCPPRRTASHGRPTCTPA